MDVPVELGEDTERIDLRDLAEDLLADFVFLVDILPRIAFQRLDREGNAGIIDTDNLTFDFLSHVKELGWVVDELPSKF